MKGVPRLTDIALLQMGFPHYGLTIEDAGVLAQRLDQWLKEHYSNLQYDFILVTNDISQRPRAAQGYMFKNTSIQDGLLCEIRLESAKVVDTGVYICKNEVYTVLVLGNKPMIKG